MIRMIQSWAKCRIPVFAQAQSAGRSEGLEGGTGTANAMLGLPAQAESLPANQKTDGR